MHAQQIGILSRDQPLPPGPNTPAMQALNAAYMQMLPEIDARKEMKLEMICRT